MLLLNSKTILDCLTKQDEVNHRNEINEVLGRIYLLPNYKTIMRYSFVDDAHQKNIDTFLHSELHEFIESIDGIDCKNGYDLGINEEGLLTVVVYGQFYMMNDAFHIVETQVSIIPFDERNKFVDITPYLAPNKKLN